MTCKFPTIESIKVLKLATQLNDFESSRMDDSTDLNSLISSDHDHTQTHRELGSYR